MAQPARWRVAQRSEPKPELAPATEELEEPPPPGTRSSCALRRGGSISAGGVADRIARLFEFALPVHSLHAAIRRLGA